MRRISFLHFDHVIYFVCRIDGTPLGEFEETELLEKVFSRKITSNDYDRHEGMADWRPVLELIQQQGEFGTIAK